MTTREDEDMGSVIDRREGNRIAVFGLLLAALTNIVTVVWFAASINSAVSQLQKSSEKSEMVMNGLVAQVASIANQVAVLQDRVMRNSEKLNPR